MSKRTVPETEKECVQNANIVEAHTSQEGVHPMTRAVQGEGEWITSSEYAETSVAKFQKMAE